MNELQELKDEAARCAKCGTCLLNCPLYPETFLEQNSSRGKLALIESFAGGDISVSKRLGQILSQCLVCNTCGEGCPNQVKTEKIFLTARKELCAQQGLPLPKKLIFRYLLSSVRFLPALLKAGSLVQGFLFKKIPKYSGLRLRFPFPLLDKKRFIPALPKKNFMELYPPVIPAAQETMRVAYFVGCATKYIFPRVGTAAVHILNKHGVTLTVPRQQVCCGLMAFGSGDWESSRKMALQNIEAFSGENVDHIVTTCASCGAALKKYYPMLFENAGKDIQDKVAAFSSKIIDISDFLINRLKVLEQPGTETFVPDDKRILVTYHDPCHLHRSQGISKPPRELLRSLPAFEFVEMENAGTCCGMGGSFNIAHYDLSLKILEKKLTSLENSQAKILVTGCMGCMLQFMDGVYQKEKDTQVLHLVEMLDQHLK